MALPKIASTTYKTKLISDENVVIEYRPFLAKEQKILLMALEGGEAEEVATAVTKILRACILTDIDIDNLPSFDMEKLFLDVRKKSIGERIDLTVGHPEHTNSTCTHKEKVSINLDELTINRNPEHKKKFKLSPQIGVVMKYPTAKTLERSGGGTEITNIFNMIADCVECVYDEETVYADFTKEEMIEWIEKLSTNQLKELTNFFYTMPEVAYDLKYTCGGCGEEVSILLKGMRDFFT